MKPGSICSFVRRELGVRGRTNHNGRGAYVMDYDIESSELEQRVRTCIDEWNRRGLLLEVEDDINYQIAIHFVPEVTEEGRYNNLYLYRRDATCAWNLRVSF